jgi:outer membrane protein assembly factor BamB
VYSSPTVSGGTVYVGSWDKYLYAVNATSGALRWRYFAGSFVSSSPAVSGGTV